MTDPVQPGQDTRPAIAPVAGKRWITRCGLITPPMQQCDYAPYPFRAAGWCWKDNGEWLWPAYLEGKPAAYGFLDIVAEHPEPSQAPDALMHRVRELENMLDNAQDDRDTWKRRAEDHLAAAEMSAKGRDSLAGRLEDYKRLVSERDETIHFQDAEISRLKSELAKRWEGGGEWLYHADGPCLGVKEDEARAECEVNAGYNGPCVYLYRVQRIATVKRIAVWSDERTKS